jgi:hypothetical protein
MLRQASKMLTLDMAVSHSLRSQKEHLP